MANNIYWATSLIGGGVGALDGIDAADAVGDASFVTLEEGDSAIVIYNGQAYMYHLNATSGVAENSPWIISPDANPGTKRWELVEVYNIKSGPLNALIYANFPGGF